MITAAQRPSPFIYLFFFEPDFALVHSRSNLALLSLNHDLLAFIDIYALRGWAAGEFAAIEGEP